MENIKVLLIGVKRYSFEDKDSGRLIEGTKAHFLQMVAAEDDNTYGFIPAVTTMPYHYYEQAKKLEMPQLCDAILTLQLSGSKPSVKVTDFVPHGVYPLTV